MRKNVFTKKWLKESYQEFIHAANKKAKEGSIDYQKELADLSTLIGIYLM